MSESKRWRKDRKRGRGKDGRNERKKAGKKGRREGQKKERGVEKLIQVGEAQE